MNPIFFPSTWIAKPTLEMLLACFKQVTVLQPARKLVPGDLHSLEESGRLEILLPDETSTEELPDLVKAYHEWADLHRGEHPDFHRFAQLTAPVPEDASTEWIRARIKTPEGDAGSVQDTPGGNAPDPLLTARLFLAIAQEYDLHSESLSSDLDDIAAMEKNMFQSLSPDEPPRASITAGKPLPPGFGPGGAMPGRRLASWRRLYAGCRRGSTASPPPSPLFVTDDPETLQLFLVRGAAPELVCRVVGIRPAGDESPFAATDAHRKIEETLRSAANGGPLSAPPEFVLGGQTSPGERIGTLTVYRLKGSPAMPGPPEQEASPEAPAAPEAAEEIPCSLLGHVERNCSLDSPK